MPVAAQLLQMKVMMQVLELITMQAARLQAELGLHVVALHDLVMLSRSRKM